MLKSYLKSAVRNIARNKLYASVTVIGLGIGLAVSLLALRYLMYEFSFDNVPDKSRIYEVTSNWRFGGVTEKEAITPPLLDMAMKSYFPEIQSATSFRLMPEYVRLRNLPERACQFCGGDTSIFSFLGIKLLQGNPRTCLLDPKSIVVTQKFARECLGSETCIGQTVDVFTNGGWSDFTVIGITTDLPLNSSISFAAVLSSANDPMMRRTQGFSGWGTLSSLCFIKLRNGVQVRDLAGKIQEFIRSTGGSVKSTSLELTPMSDVHFRTDLSTPLSTCDPKYLVILAAVGILILAVSVLNFIGINVTLLARRTKEIGIRKVEGASLRAITVQFLVENGLLIAASFIAGVSLSEIFLPLFNSMLDVELTGNLFGWDVPLAALFGIIMLLAFSVAFSSTRFFALLNVQSLIKGELGNLNPRQNLRKVLIGLQFAIAAFLICSTMIVIDQLNFIRHKDLGFEPKNLLIINSKSVGKQADVLKTELRRDPYVVDVSEASQFPTMGTSGNMSASYDQARKSVTLNFLDVDEHYIPLLGMRLINGRNFNPEFASDSMWIRINPKTWSGMSENYRVYAGAVILNQAAYKDMEAAGYIRSDSIHIMGNNWKLIGIVSDFNYSSLKNAVEPLALQFDANPMFSTLAIKFQPGKTNEVLSYVTELWKKVNPDRVLQYTFLDDDVAKMYANEDRTFDAVLSGSVAALLIALMGIFALSSFLVETKTKEIAVRKALGSSISGIIKLLSGDFVKMVLIANIIAWPGAYLVMHSWLQNYAYRISIDLFVFPGVGLIMMLLAFATILLRSVRAARANPVESLRYE